MKMTGPQVRGRVAGLAAALALAAGGTAAVAAVAAGTAGTAGHATAGRRRTTARWRWRRKLLCCAT